jgi:endogenous inhibitor of DNA gyrase (YacG/DUF329 family)
MSSEADNPPPSGGCPICGKACHPRFHPFCSRRCADIDLGRWLKGGYAIPGGAATGADDSPSGEPGPDEAPEN